VLATAFLLLHGDYRSGGRLHPINGGYQRLVAAAGAWWDGHIDLVEARHGEAGERHGSRDAADGDGYRAGGRRAADFLELQAKADPTNISTRQRLSEILTDVAGAMIATGQKAEARREAERGLAIARELADRPNATQEQVSNFASLAAEVEPVELRDPPTVLPYALKAVEMSGDKDEFSLYTLAETYAAMGDYAKAVETGEKAAALFPPLQPGEPKPSQQETIEKSLQEYRDALARGKK